MSDLVVTNNAGGFTVQAASPAYSAETVTVNVRVTLSHVDPSIYFDCTFPVIITCNELTLSSFFQPMYYYTIGDSLTAITLPATGVITRDSCANDCSVTVSVTGTHGWLTIQPNSLDL